MTNSKPSSWPPIKIIFPSLSTVDSSVGGRDGGGTIFAGKGWNANTKDLFYDSNSKRGGILMHAKVSIGIHVKKSIVRNGELKMCVDDDSYIPS